MLENAWECLRMLENAWECLRMLENAWECLRMLENAWGCLRMLKNAWECLRMLENAGHANDDVTDVSLFTRPDGQRCHCQNSSHPGKSKVSNPCYGYGGRISVLASQETIEAEECGQRASSSLRKGIEPECQLSEHPRMETSPRSFTTAIPHSTPNRTRAPCRSWTRGRKHHMCWKTCKRSARVQMANCKYRWWAVCREIMGNKWRIIY